ncbi:hypothetical protein [Shewanella sp. KCT]|uniref:hypothetical protein n=1 Tax=Shewanella sp. KCT TaxID=2569535 RepID=UPI001183CDB0|nr:hypothetical protein [Shewanella sp. KCT]TVP09809.1 hypothetical protein AYI87_19150 [Shewanella sp. KCT]
MKLTDEGVQRDSTNSVKSSVEKKGWPLSKHPLAGKTVYDPTNKCDRYYPRYVRPAIDGEAPLNDEQPRITEVTMKLSEEAKARYEQKMIELASRARPVEEIPFSGKTVYDSVTKSYLCVPQDDEHTNDHAALGEIPGWVLKEDGQWQFIPYPNENLAQGLFRCIQAVSEKMESIDFLYLLIMATDYISQDVLKSAGRVQIGTSVVMESSGLPQSSTQYRQPETDD